MTSLDASELILNEDGSIYHLNLFPEDLAPTVITVGDPDRVAEVSKHFATIETKKGKREFITHTGWYDMQRISVISTGIGTDNIDIVLNELDALVNIDFKTRREKINKTSLNIIRIGTTGSIQKEIKVDSILASQYAIGLDGLLHYYQSESVQEADMQEAFIDQIHWPSTHPKPYIIAADQGLVQAFQEDHLHLGTTATNVGFYGPQSRVLRLPLSNAKLVDSLSTFHYKNQRITNLEMESSAIYGLSKLLGHKAISLNSIVANRINGTVTQDPKLAMERLIVFALDKISKI
ncbi:nucleoside phosphorylase [Galbibacter sp.]|uniref:nucleoside phosphorylase n=1 Tax=Galbibacter sp. TaxID=2918471 RepID=UPI002BAD4145|nr:nucleoside phosphorylase [Galbibacter sp.]HLV62441.1 nucleoside phosphorylase [Galbibacter sp.]